MADIELVIKIPEETYKDIIENGFIYDEDNEVVTHAIKNGTPLDDLRAEIQDLYVGYRHGYEIMADVLQIIDKYREGEQ